MTQVETIWSFINHSNCEVKQNRTFRSGRFGHGTFQSHHFCTWTTLHSFN